MLRRGAENVTANGGNTTLPPGAGHEGDAAPDSENFPALRGRERDPHKQGSLECARGQRREEVLPFIPAARNRAGSLIHGLNFV